MTTASVLDPRDPQACLSGGGEAGALMRGIDWNSHPLGPVADWPLTLRTMVRVMLDSRFGMRLVWGTQFIFLYNDAYRPVLGASKHPSAMGSHTEQSFAEVWNVVGPLFARVLAGEAFGLEDTPLPLNRNGFLEECYFTLSYSPVRIEDGTVGGVLGVVAETTERVLAERRLRTLRDLAARAALAHDPERACEVAAEVLAKNPADVPFSLFYLSAPDGREARLVARAGLPLDSPAAPPVIALESEDSVWPLGAAGAAGQTQTVRDVVKRFGKIAAGPYAEAPERAMVLALTRPGLETPYGFLVAGCSARLGLADTYVGFFELAAEHIATALANAAAIADARSHAEERATLLASEQRARLEAERSNRAKDEFLAIVSHELRNPLSAMLGWTRMLRSGTVPPEKQERALETIERNAVNQSQLIEDLLDISRIISGKLKLDVQSVDLMRVVESAIESARPAVAARQIKLTSVLDDNVATVMGDAPRLQQVVWNLLTNACKFTPRGGSIRVVLKKLNSELELAVTDSGQGIASDFLPYVFDRFQQADPSPTRQHGGLGLGLSISKNIIEMHGGTISVHSEGAERGATFVVRIPIASVHDARRDSLPGQPLELAAPSWPSPPELMGLRVLVVDDEPDSRELVAAVLAQCGALVSTASSASDALARLENERPDVLVSDIGMPGEDGYSLIRKVRALAPERGGTTPAASLTAYASADDRKRALMSGFHMHISKPAEPSELVLVVANLARIARAMR